MLEVGEYHGPRHIQHVQKDDSQSNWHVAEVENLCSWPEDKVQLQQNTGSVYQIYIYFHC